MIAKQVYYAGHVQGVGFRYTTLQIAGSFDVAGWVRNLPDGRVEIQVKGTADQVEAFLSQIRNHRKLSGCIRHEEILDLPIERLDGVTGLSIRHAADPN